MLSIYGSEDGVLNMKKIEEGRKYMPEKYIEVKIEGGNHAQFGDYGFQKGDSEPKITAKKQIDISVSAILDFIG